MHQKRFVLGYLVLLFIGIVLACFVAYNVYCMPRSIDVTAIPIDNDIVQWNVNYFGDDSEDSTACGDRLRYSGNGSTFLRIYGWACINDGKDIKTTNSYYLLKNEKTNEFIRLQTEMRKRPDVTEYIAENIRNIDMAGLEAICPKSALEKGTSYSLFILYGNDGYNFLVDLDLQITME